MNTHLSQTQQMSDSENHNNKNKYGVKYKKHCFNHWVQATYNIIIIIKV